MGTERDKWDRWGQRGTGGDREGQVGTERDRWDREETAVHIIRTRLLILL